MSEPKIIKEYANEYAIFPVFECEECGGSMQEWFEDGGIFICPDCAYRKGVATDEEYLDVIVPSAYRDGARVCIYNDEIFIALKREKFPFEKTNSDYRNCKEYSSWRSKVFERDNFTCQICKKVGGTLNAHHIKPFKDYPLLRFDVDNGITLCESCHKELHKRLRNGRKR